MYTSSTQEWKLRTYIRNNTFFTEIATAISKIRETKTTEAYRREKATKLYYNLEYLIKLCAFAVEALGPRGPQANFFAKRLSVRLVETPLAKCG